MNYFILLFVFFFPSKKKKMRTNRGPWPSLWTTIKVKEKPKQHPPHSHGIKWYRWFLFFLIVCFVSHPRKKKEKSPRSVDRWRTKLSRLRLNECSAFSGDRERDGVSILNGNAGDRDVPVWLEWQTAITIRTLHSSAKESPNSRTLLRFLSSLYNNNNNSGVGVFFYFTPTHCTSVPCRLNFSKVSCRSCHERRQGSM